MTANPSDRELFENRRDPEARAAIVERYDSLAQQLARKFRGRGTPLDDLIQVARFGLLNAIDRFDVDRGIRFSTFAGRTIVGEIKHHFRKEAWTVRVPRSLQNLWLRTNDAIEQLSQQLSRSPTIAEIAEHLDVDEDEVLEAMDAGGGFTTASLDRPIGATGETTVGELLGSRHPVLERTPERAGLADAIEDLPERERAILFMRFFEGRTQQEIATQVGISQVHVSRLLRQTLADLRGSMAGSR